MPRIAKPARYLLWTRGRVLIPKLRINSVHIVEGPTMATEHCRNHYGVSPYFLKFTDTNSWTLNNLIQWAQCDNTQGEVQNTYKNSLLYIQKPCEGECFTEAQRARAGGLLKSFDSAVSNPSGQSALLQLLSENLEALSSF